MGDLAEPKKLNALTGLRFFAALLIVIHHSSVFDLHVPNFFYDHGVSFFFVLSGFILAHVHPRLDGKREVALFIWDRIARIWPAHVVMLLVVVAVLRTPLTLAFPLNFLLVQGWIPVGKYYFSYNAVSWSVSTELAFYLSFPFFIHRWEQTFWWKISLAVVIVFATIKICDILQLGGYQPESITRHGLIYISPLGRILEFVTGIACYSVYRWFRSRAPCSFALFTAIEMLSVCLLYFTMSGWLSNCFYAGASSGLREWLVHSSSLPSCAVAVVVFAFGGGLLSRGLSARPIVLLGEISFSLYLVHQFVDILYLNIFPRVSTTQPDFWGAIVSACAAIFLSFALWRLIEVPTRHALRRIVRTNLLGKNHGRRFLAFRPIEDLGARLRMLETNRPRSEAIKRE